MSRCRPLLLPFLGVLAALWVIPCSVRAGVIASESFAYDAGSPLNGLSGGSGWATPWIPEHAGDTTVTVVAPGLSYTDSLGNALAVAGNKVLTGFGNAGFREISGGPLGAASGSVWISFLATGPIPTPPSDENYLWAGISLYDGTEEQLFLGKGAESEYRWAVQGLGNLSSLGPQLTSTSTATAVFFVAELVFQPGANAIHVWINPDLVGAPSLGSAALNLDLSSLPAYQFDQVRLAGSELFTFDELRIGTTYGDVAPTPEPSAIAAALIGLLSVASVSVLRRARATVAARA